LRGIFLDYWNKHGGLAQFGYPLTEEFFEPISTDNKLYRVQYFERARLEHHPENAGTPHEVLLGLLGRELAERKSYFAGAYPLYGHAADFSWISGKLVLYGPREGACGTCSCSILQYGEDITRFDGIRFQFAGEIWWRNGVTNFKGNVEGTNLVAWGRPAAMGEAYLHCAGDPDAPGYFVDHVLVNPLP
jgi:hypothetical protein